MRLYGLQSPVLGPRWFPPHLENNLRDTCGGAHLWSQPLGG
jgi:hypothetical protein